MEATVTACVRPTAPVGVTDFDGQPLVWSYRNTCVDFIVQENDANCWNNGNCDTGLTIEEGHACWASGDFNGDGLVDLVNVTDTSGDLEFWVALNTGGLDKVSKHVPGRIAGVLFAAMVCAAGAAGWLGSRLLDPWRGPTIAAAAVAVPITWLLCRRRPRQGGPKVPRYVVLRYVGIGFAAYAVILFVNVLCDWRQPLTVRVDVLWLERNQGGRYRSGKQPTYTAITTSWRGRRTERINVGSDDLRDVPIVDPGEVKRTDLLRSRRTGRKMRVHVKPGTLGFPWVAGYEHVPPK